MYNRLTDLNLLYDAFQKCIKGVSWKCSIQRYEANVLVELMKIRESLLNHTYRQKAFFEFDINERGKHRHIKSLHISDRVLQRNLCDNILIPCLYKELIYDNGASVKGKGIEFTRNRFIAHLQKFYRRHGNKGYILLVDFSKFFDSIPHEQLMEMLREKIPDKEVLDLIEYLVSTFGEEKSLGIGSQISQIFGIFYPTRLDNYIKIVKGCKYYGRYMDDFYIIHEDKAYLKNLLIEIRKIAGDMGLTINEHKTQICRIDKGFIFLKTYYFMTDTGKIVKRPCKKNVTRERRKLKKLKTKMDYGEAYFDDIYQSYKSWRGSIKKYNSYYTIQNMDRLFGELYGEQIYAECKSLKSKRREENSGRIF